MAALALQIGLGHAQPTVQWATTAGSGRDDLPQAIALLPAGDLLVAGTFDYQDVTQPEGVLYRFGPSGTFIGGQPSRGEQIRAVAVDSNGNYYLTGRVWDADRLGTGVLNDFYLAKYSPAGTLLWERATGSGGSHRKYAFTGGSKVALDAAGNLCVAGRSCGSTIFGNVTFPATPGGPLLCKYNPEGTLLWAKRVEGASGVYPDGSLSGMGGELGDMVLDHEGNIIISGYLNNGQADFGGTVVKVAGANGGQSFVAKFNQTGAVLWVRVGSGANGPADRQGNVYFCANTTADGVSFSMQCGKLGPTGDLLWQRTVANAYGYAVALDGKDEPVFAAEFYGSLNLDGHVVQASPNTGTKLLICKANASGVFQWAVGDEGQSWTTAMQILCDRSGNIYSAGGMRCVYQNGGWVCEAGLLGAIPLPPPSEGTTDIFAARLSDPTAVVVELKSARTASGLALSWPAEAADYVLEATTSLPAASWTTVTNTPTVTTTNRSLQLPLGDAARFFRLRKP